MNFLNTVRVNSSREGEVITKSINRGIVLTIVLVAFMVIPAMFFGDIGLPVITYQGRALRFREITERPIKDNKAVHCHEKEEDLHPSS